MKVLFFVLFFGLSLSVFAGPSRDKYNNGFPEEKYHQILDQFLQTYGPRIEARGGEFIIWRDWSDGAVNMWAEKWGPQYILEIPGGMARYSLIKEEAFILSVCHELGHLIGGAPQNGEISFEGQSDYFAGRDCIQEMLAQIPPIKAEADPEADSFCQRPNLKKDSDCRRFVVGAKSLTAYYAEILNVPFPQISTPSSETVSETLSGHPRPQCRLDTLLAGYRGLPRPSCWYF